MDLILVNIGGTPPDYLFDCIRQVRRYSDDRIIIGTDYPDMRDLILTRDLGNNITIYPLNKFDNHYLIKSFDENSFFKAFEWKGFWEYAAKRLLYVYTIMEFFKLNSALHIEIDNLMYASPRNIAGLLHPIIGDSVGVMQCTDTLDIASMLYAGSLDAMKIFSEKIDSLVCMGVNELKYHYGDEMLNEMRLMNIARTKLNAPMRLMPIVPQPGLGFICDPASYGQYIGGTNQEKKPGFIDPAHIVAREVLQKEHTITWELSGPYIDGVPLLNLHVHSKQLKKWMHHV